MGIANKWRIFRNKPLKRGIIDLFLAKLIARVQVNAHRKDTLPKRSPSKHIEKHSKVCGIVNMKSIVIKERETRNVLSEK